MFDVVAMVAINSLIGLQADEARTTQARLESNYGPQANQRASSQAAGISRKTYDCAGCGAPLFGIVNENCRYCKRPT